MARAALSSWSHCHELRCSYFYQSSPVGYAEQDDFINCVLAIDVSCQAEQLLQYSQQIELQLGRERDPGNQNAPRMIDIDILLFGQQEIKQDKLIVPHPRWQQRLFVLKPLLDVIHQSQKPMLDQLLEERDFSDQIVHRLLV